MEYLLCRNSGQGTVQDAESGSEIITWSGTSRLIPSFLGGVIRISSVFKEHDTARIKTTVYKK